MPDQTQTQNTFSRHIPAFISFFAILLFIFIEGWDTKDLVWGLWFSSITTGYITILCVIYVQARPTRPSQSPFVHALQYIGAFGGAAFMLLFFTFHFGLFHIVHSVFLQIFFPLEGTTSIIGNFFSADTAAQAESLMSIANVTQGEEFQTFSKGMLSFLPNYLIVIFAYWPIAVVTFFANIPTLAEGIKKRSLSFGTPYANVIRLHLAIFALAFLSFMGLENFWLYAFIFTIFYFPWSSVVTLKNDKNTTQSIAQASSNNPKDSPVVKAPTKTEPVKLEDQKDKLKSV